jgi:hypothetical protein
VLSPSEERAWKSFTGLLDRTMPRGLIVGDRERPAHMIAIAVTFARIVRIDTGGKPLRRNIL